MHSLSQPDHLALAQLSQSRALPVVSRWAVKMAYLTLVWTRRSRTRAQLHRLSPSELEDIGITADQAHEEQMKWFWRP